MADPLFMGPLMSYGVPIAPPPLMPILGLLMKLFGGGGGEPEVMQQALAKFGNLLPFGGDAGAVGMSGLAGGAGGGALQPSASDLLKTVLSPSHQAPPTAMLPPSLTQALGVAGGGSSLGDLASQFRPDLQRLLTSSRDTIRAGPSVVDPYPLVKGGQTDWQGTSGPSTPNTVTYDNAMRENMRNVMDIGTKNAIQGKSFDWAKLKKGIKMGKEILKGFQEVKTLFEGEKVSRAEKRRRKRQQERAEGLFALSQVMTAGLPEIAQSLRQPQYNLENLV